MFDPDYVLNPGVVLNRVRQRLSCKDQPFICQLGIAPAGKHLQALLCLFAAGPSPTAACLDSSPVAQPRCCRHTVLKMTLLCAGPRPAPEAPEAEPSHARAHRQLHRVRLLREQLPQQGRHADAPPAHHHPARAGPPEGHALPHSWPASQVCSPVPAADLLGHGLPSGACGISLLQHRAGFCMANTRCAVACQPASAPHLRMAHTPAVALHQPVYQRCQQQLSPGRYPQAS